MSQVRELIRYAAEGAELFHAPDGTAYATVEVDGHYETHPTKSVRFKDWLLIRFLREHGRAPNSQLLTDALNTVRAFAVYRGPEMPVFVRVAEHEGDIYIDLGDAAWNAVRVTRDGWSVVSDPPVRFVRKAGFAPLPIPQPDGTVEELRSFLNVGSNDDFMLMAAWTAFSLSPWGPYPVLVLQGEQGSAKSTTVRVLRSLVDPAVEPLRALPKNERDLAIAANNSWVLAYDNLSGIRDQLSDALCRLATGGGFATRQLYTDDEEIIFRAKRPVILNGIDDIATRGDLQERSLLIPLPSIPEKARVEEAAFWSAFEAARPRVFGALLSGVSAAIRNASSVHLERKPRMADFAVRATAMEGAFRWEAGSFVEAYAANRREATETLLANEPLFDAIEKLVSNYSGSSVREWSGTATALLKDLGFYADDDIKRSRAWPGGPQALSRKMRRLAPALRAAGYEYLEGEEGHSKKKVKILRRIAQTGKAETAAAKDGAGEPESSEPKEPETEALDAEASDGAEDHEDQNGPDDDKVRGVGNPFIFNWDEPTDTEG